MKNNYSKKLLSSVLLATSLSAVSVNNKVANAAFESYKRDERKDLNNFVENTKHCQGMKIKDTYIDLLKTLKKILVNRKDANSLLKNSMGQTKLSVDILENEIKRVTKLENEAFLSCQNLSSLFNFIQKIERLSGGYCTVWSNDVINAVLTLRNNIQDQILLNEKPPINY